MEKFLREDNKTYKPGLSSFAPNKFTISKEKRPQETATEFRPQYYKDILNK